MFMFVLSNSCETDALYFLFQAGGLAQIYVVKVCQGLRYLDLIACLDTYKYSSLILLVMIMHIYLLADAQLQTLLLYKGML